MSARLCVSVRHYYCYRLQTRPAIFNPILHGKRLFQQFAVDMYIKVEGTRLDWVRNHQKEIRADLYKGVIGMVLFVSSMGHKDSFYNRRIPVRNIVLLDDTYIYLMV